MLRIISTWLKVLVLAVAVVVLSTVVVGCGNGDSGSGSISGTVTNEQGEPVAGVGVSILLWHEDEFFMERFEVATDEDGKYTIENLPDGYFEIRFASNSDYYFNGSFADIDFSGFVSVANGADMDGIDFPLEAGNPVSISGRVVNEGGEPIYNTLVSSGNGWTYTDIEGRYELRGLYPSESPFITVGDEGKNPRYAIKHVSAEEGIPSLSAGDTAELEDIVLRELDPSTHADITDEPEFSGTTIEVQALRPDGSPAVYARGTLRALTGEELWSTGFSIDEDGTGVARNWHGELLSGDYLVEIHDSDGNIGYEIVTIAEGEETVEVSIRLEQGSVVFGSVVDEGGKPLFGIDVSASLVHEDSWSMPHDGAFARTLRDGRFRLVGLSAGEYELHTSLGWGNEWRGNHAFSTVVISLEQGQKLADLVMQAEKSGLIQGTVTDVSDNPASDITVHAVRAVSNCLNEHINSHVVATGTTDSNGNFELTGLTSGRYMILLIDSETWQFVGNEAIDVVAGDEPTIFNFSLIKGVTVTTGGASTEVPSMGLDPMSEEDLEQLIEEMREQGMPEEIIDRVIEENVAANAE